MQSVFDSQEIEMMPIWPFILLLFLSAVVLYSRAVDFNAWRLIFRSTYSARASGQLLREENIINNTLSGLLVFNFFLSLTLFFFDFLSYYSMAILSSYPIALYAIILFLLFLFYILKVCLLYCLRIVFEEAELFREYTIVFMNISIVLGIWLIPLNLFFSYAIDVPKEHILTISGFLLFAAIILLNVRVFEMGMRRKLKWYNIFLYLCTLEITPIILIMILAKKVGINLDLG